MSASCHEVVMQESSNCDSNEEDRENDDKNCCGDDCHCFCCGYFGHVFTFSTVKSQVIVAPIAHSADQPRTIEIYAHLHNKGIWQPPRAILI